MPGATFARDVTDPRVPSWVMRLGGVDPQHPTQPTGMMPMPPVGAAVGSAAEVLGKSFRPSAIIGDLKAIAKGTSDLAKFLRDLDVAALSTDLGQIRLFQEVKKALELGDPIARTAARMLGFAKGLTGETAPKAEAAK